MKIAIRADASIAIGTGHIMRCLTLAEALRSQQDDITFICREVAGNCCNLIADKGFNVMRLPAADEFDAAHDAEQTAGVIGAGLDWLIVDHYGIGATWERQLRPHGGQIMVIDDLADRHHDCDLLLDQNLFDNQQQRYDTLVPPGCRLFLGPRYALLREEFITAQQTLRQRDGTVRRILLFFGGSDPTNETEKTLLSINRPGFREISVDVVVGSANPNGDRIQNLCNAMENVSFHRQITNMAELMAQADLAIGAGGTATWERCLLGLPTLVVVVADNQAHPAQTADKAGVVRLVGVSAEVTATSLAMAIETALQTPPELARMASRCRALMGVRNAPVHDEILTSLHGVSDAP